jgi:hypothetical protein
MTRPIEDEVESWIRAEVDAGRVVDPIVVTDAMLHAHPGIEGAKEGITTLRRDGKPIRSLPRTAVNASPNAAVPPAGGAPRGGVDHPQNARDRGGALLHGPQGPGLVPQRIRDP